MRESILKLLDRAMEDVDTLPPVERADLYDAAAELLGNANPALSLAPAAAAAACAAAALREAEARQLTFAELLRKS